MYFVDCASILADFCEALSDDPVSKEVIEVVENAVYEYDRMCPPREQWPENMNYFAVDGFGCAWWHENMPKAYGVEWKGTGKVMFSAKTNIPLGIDWRECVWEKSLV